MESKTIIQYDEVVNVCKDVFTSKSKDYGTSWRVLRTTSVTDQLFIKAQRIKNIDQLKEKKVDEGIEAEYVGIVNYSIIGLIQLELGTDDAIELSSDMVAQHYDQNMEDIKELMEAKNHDYGEAWREMRVSSFTDQILMKIMRIKQIEDNEGETLVSEGIDAIFRDIVNYAIFAMIKLKERDENMGSN